jgi:hypothetical protein
MRKMFVGVDIHIDNCIQQFKISYNERRLSHIEWQILTRLYNELEFFKDKTWSFIDVERVMRLDLDADYIIDNANYKDRLEIVLIRYGLLQTDALKLKHWEVVWGDFYRVYGSVVGVYFRNMYNVVSSFSEIFKGQDFTYGKLFRAQMNRSEIALLYFNLLGEYSSKKFYTLVEKYKLLKGLYPSDVIELPGHGMISSIDDMMDLLKAKYES